MKEKEGEREGERKGWEREERDEMREKWKRKGKNGSRLARHPLLCHILPPSCLPSLSVHIGNRNLVYV